MYGHAGTAIRRGGHGHSVFFQNSSLHWVFLVRQEIAFGKHTTKPTHTQNLRLKYLLMTKLQPIEAHYIHCYKMPPSRPTLVQEHKHFG
jgi:hypothetical protein